jgi:hypothetical protein
MQKLEEKSCQKYSNFDIGKILHNIERSKDKVMNNASSSYWAFGCQSESQKQITFKDINF